MTCREGIIDMSGPGAKFCTNSDTLNLVIRFIPLSDSTNIEHDDAVRLVTLRISSWLASLTKDISPKETKVFELTDVDPTLPKVVYVDQEVPRETIIEKKEMVYVPLPTDDEELLKKGRFKAPDYDKDKKK